MAKKILIVEDDPEIIQLLYTLFVDNYDVTLAEDGQAALDVAGNILPDLMILDIELPHIDGYEVCKRIKREPKTSNIKVLILTGMAQDYNLTQSIAAGADEFVTKPFSITELANKVSTLLASTTD